MSPCSASLSGTKGFTAGNKNICVFAKISLVQFPQAQVASAGLELYFCYYLLIPNTLWPLLFRSTGRIALVCSGKPCTTWRSLFQHPIPAPSLFQEITIIIIFWVWCLVVLLIKPIQVCDLLEQLKDAVPVVLKVCNLTVEQVKTLQILQILLKINENILVFFSLWCS